MQELVRVDLAAFLLLAKLLVPLDDLVNDVAYRIAQIGRARQLNVRKKKLAKFTHILVFINRASIGTFI